MEKGFAVKVEGLSKIFKLYDKPINRLKEALHPTKKKYHTSFYAVDNVSLEIRKGETIGIIGKNGSGKSTLLKMIAGVLTQTTGTISIDGNISAILELGAGFNPEYTGIENIYLSGAIRGYSKEEMEKRIPNILSFADIGEFIKKPVKNYSSGMFARLAFSVAINVDPDVLIIDEVLAVGDMAFQLKCIDKMKEIKKSGVTILFVSHDIYSIKNFCDKTIWMKDGKINIFDDTFLVTQMYEDYMKLLSNKVEVQDKGKISSSNGCNNAKEIYMTNDAYEDKGDYTDILTINCVKFLSKEGNEVNTIQTGEDLIISVDYTLYKRFEGIVGGIAIFNNESIYVCGLNTKLDQVTIPSEPGEYKLYIKYPNLPLLGGTYKLDVGFMESSGIKVLDYKAKDYSFKIVEKEYSAEGITKLEHTWGVSKFEV